MQAGGYAALRKQNPPASGAWWHLDDAVGDPAPAADTLTPDHAGGGCSVAEGRGLGLSDAGWRRMPRPFCWSNRLSQIAEQPWPSRIGSSGLAAVEEALATLPVTSNCWFGATVFAERLGDDAQAHAYGERPRAPSLAATRLVTRFCSVSNRFQAGDLAGAAAAADEALAWIAENPQVSLSWWATRGGGDIRGAIDRLPGRSRWPTITIRNWRCRAGCAMECSCSNCRSSRFCPSRTENASETKLR